MFIKNKYYNWYYSIIHNARARAPVGYVEKHHITSGSQKQFCKEHGISYSEIGSMLRGNREDYHGWTGGYL